MIGYEIDDKRIHQIETKQMFTNNIQILFEIKYDRLYVYLILINFTIKI